MMTALVLAGVAALYLIYAVLGRIATALENLAGAVDLQNRHYGIVGVAQADTPQRDPAGEQSTPA